MHNEYRVVVLSSLPAFISHFSLYANMHFYLPPHHTTNYFHLVMLLRRLFILHYVQRTHQTITSSIRLPSFVYHIIAIMFTFLFTVRPPWYLKYHIFF